RREEFESVSRARKPFAVVTPDFALLTLAPSDAGPTVPGHGRFLRRCHPESPRSPAPKPHARGRHASCLLPRPSRRVGARGHAGVGHARVPGTARARAALPAGRAAVAGFSLVRLGRAELTQLALLTQTRALSPARMGG